jgi:hypothetical protein
VRDNGTYNGDKDTDGNKHGQGTLTFSDGGKYEGEWQHDKKHGQGTFTYANGDTYVGEYRQGNRHGQGTFTFANGGTYVGEYRQGKKHGKGTFTYANGDTYVSEYRQGNRHGKGTFTEKNGSAHEREYVDGELVKGTKRPSAADNGGDEAKSKRARPPHSQVHGSQSATYSFSALLLTLLPATHALACTTRLAPFACLRPHTIRISVCALCLAAHTIHKAPRQQQNPPAKGKERKRKRVRIRCNMHLPCPHTHPVAIAREHLFARSRSASRCASSLEKSTLEFGHITSLQCSLHLDLGHIISHTHWKAENFPTV